MDSIFSNFHKLIGTWPDGFTSKHLKRNVIKFLVEERASVSTKLQHLLDNSKESYSSAVEKMYSQNNKEPLPPGLGHFILGAISLMGNVPVYVIEPLVSRKTDENNRSIVEFGAQMSFLFPGEKKSAGLGMTPWCLFTTA